jgi:hypothetical protein
MNFSRPIDRTIVGAYLPETMATVLTARIKDHPVAGRTRDVHRSIASPATSRGAEMRIAKLNCFGTIRTPITPHE